MFQDVTAISILILALLLIGNIFFLFLLAKKMHRLKERSQEFFSGRNGKDLESIILSQMKHIKKINGDIQDLYEAATKIHTLAHAGLYKVGYKRFNPFKDVGGNQSFALALLDGKNNGIVISSLYTREATRVYAKPVINGKATEEYPFTEEESETIASASLKKII